MHMPPNATAVEFAAADDRAWENALAVLGTDAALQVLEEKTSYTEVELNDIGRGTMSQSGIQIGPESALRISAVFACRRVIGEDVAKMPRLLKRTVVDPVTGTTSTRVLHPSTKTSNPKEARLVSIARLLAWDPCEWLTPMQFFEWLTGTAVTQRAAYAYPVVDKRSGEVLELLPLLPGAVSVHQNSNWDVEYRVHGYGESLMLKPGEIVQLTGPINQTTLDGYEVSALARESIALAAAIEQSQSRFHRNDMRPSGILTTKQVVDAKQRDAIKHSWQSAYGPGGSGGVAVLDSEFDYRALTVTSTDAQTLENRQHQVSEICRFFRVFPQLIGHAGGLQGYGSFEQAMENHTKLTLMPWVERLEQALMKGLLTHEDRIDGWHIHIDVDSIARGTFTDRVNAYEKAVKVFLTPDEVRAREGLDPLGDEAMRRVQLQANNTGIIPTTSRTPAATVKPTADSAKE